MTIKLFFMLFLACSLHTAFSIPAESNDPITRYWVFLSWTKKGTNKHCPPPKLNQISVEKNWKIISNLSFISYLRPYCWVKNYPFPNNSLRFPVHDYIHLCLFSPRANKACFSLESHAGMVLDQELNIIHI